MTVRCPQCSAIAPIGDDNLGDEGRMLRCRACGTRWLARTFASDPYRPPAVVPFVADQRANEGIVIEHVGAGFAVPPPSPAPKRRASPPLLTKPRDWRRLTIAGTVLAALVAIVAFRSPILAALPGALPEEVTLLEFQSVRSETLHLGSTSTLLVEGQIINRSSEDVPLPAIRITLRSPAGDPVSSWLVEPSVTGLAPGRSIGFRSALASPPPDAAQVTLNLAAREGI
jgi:predicted Zn finger-like uncharacterized protein